MSVLNNLNQPLVPINIQNSTDIKDIEKAYRVCQNILKNAYQENGINAGETHFSDVWLRDSCFASIGALCLNDTAIVKQALTKIMDNMKDDGQCPLRIGEIYFMLKYFKCSGPQGPTYIEDKYISIPVDSNALFIIVAYHYILSTNDDVFLKSHYNNIKKALDWYGQHLDNHLVIEGPYAGWADSVKKTGHVLYTNSLYCFAIHCISELAKRLCNKNDELNYNELYQKTKTRFNEVFWNGSYLNDWVNLNITKDHLSIDGNALAILFDLIDQEKQQRIADEVLKRSMITPYGIKSVDRPYSWKDGYFPFLFVGLKDYHNGLNWLWLSAIASMALAKAKKSDSAIDLMRNVSNVILKYKTVYEVYTKEGRPVNRLFYKSERGFAWSAGCFIWSYSALFGNKAR
jgi:glycogen debranching enzyme